jgi:hypothetical protein
MNAARCSVTSGGDPVAGIRSARDRPAHASAADSGRCEQPRTASLTSNLPYMLKHPEIGENHNASAFRWCYRRIGEWSMRVCSQG